MARYSGNSLCRSCCTCRGRGIRGIIGTRNKLTRNRIFDYPAAMQRLSINFTADQISILESVMAAEGYDSPTGALGSFLADWAAIPRARPLAHFWSRLPGAARDEINSKLAQLVRPGPGSGSPFLRRNMLQDIRVKFGAPREPLSLTSLCAECLNRCDGPQGDGGAK